MPSAPVTTKVFVSEKCGAERQNASTFVFQARYQESGASLIINSGRREKRRAIQEGNRWKFVPLL